MDRQTMLEHLAMAERHVAEGVIHLSRQRALIAELDRDGHDGGRTGDPCDDARDAAASHGRSGQHPQGAEFGIDVHRLIVAAHE